MRVRRVAAEALSTRKDRDDAIDSILFKWQNAANAAAVAERSADALAALPSPKSEKALVIRRKQSDPALADAVATAWLATVAPPASLEEVKKVLRTDDSPRRRAQAAAAVARWAGVKPGEEKALDLLVQAIGSERSPAVREAILRAAGAWPKEVLDAALVERATKGDADARTAILSLAWNHPLAGLEDVARKALKATATVQVASGLLALGASPSPDKADDAEIAARLAHAEPVVRDAAIEALLRRAGDPAARRALLEGKGLPTAARIALLASLAAPASPENVAALVEGTKSGDSDVIATAIGALRRGQGAAGRDALAEVARSGGARAKAIVAGVTAAMSESSKPRAYVVRGNDDRGELALPELGYEVVAYSSGSGLATLHARPEDVVYVDGPGEIDARGLAALETFLHLGGTVVLASGLQNVVLKALCPDAFDASPKGLKLESGTFLSAAISDRLVVPALGSPDALVATLAASPNVLVVVAPVIPRTAAARPLLWSLDMEEAYGGAPCVTAEVHVGCGRVLATGAVLGLKGTESAEGWFARVRVDRPHPQRLPNAPDLRYWVAYDWLGVTPERLSFLLQKNYFDGSDAMAGAADLPQGRFLAAYLKLR